VNLSTTLETQNREKVSPTKDIILIKAMNHMFFLFKSKKSKKRSVGLKSTGWQRK